MCERAFARHYHPAAILFPPQLKILCETLIGDLRAIVMFSVSYFPNVHYSDIYMYCTGGTHSYNQQAFSMWRLFLPHSNETCFNSS